MHAKAKVSNLRAATLRRLYGVGGKSRLEPLREEAGTRGYAALCYAFLLHSYLMLALAIIDQPQLILNSSLLCLSTAFVPNVGIGNNFMRIGKIV